MRPLTSRSAIIEEVAARGFSSNEDGFNIAYDWREEDVQTEGQFMGWWTFILEGHRQDTPEFPIVITDHGPGEGVQLGIIVNGVGAEMPVTFDALKRDQRFGDRFMQAKAELVKYKVLGHTMPADEEATLHPMLLDYFSKRVALELVPPGIDYWQRQHRTVTTTQTSEVASYPDAIASLEKLNTRLRCDCKDLWQELQFIVPGLPKRKIIHFPTSDLAHFPAVTPGEPTTLSPYESQPLETGTFGWDLALGVFPFP